MNANNKILLNCRVKLRYLFLLITIIVMIIGVYAKIAPKKEEFIQESIYQQVTSDVRYNHEKQHKGNIPKDYSSLRYAVYGLLVFAGAALFWFIIFEEKILRLPKKGKRQRTIHNPSYTSNEELETRLTEADLKNLLNEAIVDKNFQFALRIHFVMLIRMMNSKGLLQYRIDKSNRDYINELSDNSFRQAFKTIVKIYELVWFGEIRINQQDYQSVSVEFELMIQKLQ